MICYCHLTCVAVQGGQVVDRVDGVHIPEVARKSRSHGSAPFLSSTAPSSTTVPQKKEASENCYMIGSEYGKNLVVDFKGCDFCDNSYK